MLVVAKVVVESWTHSNSDFWVEPKSTQMDLILHSESRLVAWFINSLARNESEKSFGNVRHLGKWIRGIARMSLNRIHKVWCSSLKSFARATFVQISSVSDKIWR